MDTHGNTIAEEGVDRCICGSKYWEHDKCVDCGAAVEKIPVAISVHRNDIRTRGTSTVYDLVVSGERVAIVRKVEGASRMITPTHWRLRFAGAEKDVDYKFWTRASAVEYARREMEKR